MNIYAVKLTYYKNNWMKLNNNDQQKDDSKAEEKNEDNSKFDQLYGINYKEEVSINIKLLHISVYSEKI